MKLSKALKLKNKKVTEYNDAKSKMVVHNSYDIDSNKIYNAKDKLGTAKLKLDDLVKFKTAIHKTSEPIREKIFRLSELKTFISSLNMLSTVEGVVKSSNYGGSASVATYKADINEVEKVKLIQSTQDEIDSIQDEIDIFNATTDLAGYNVTVFNA